MVVRAPAKTAGALLPDQPHRQPDWQPDRRRDNLVTILALLRREGPWSRARLSEVSGLSRATVSDLVDDLARRGLVVLGDGRADGRPGRPGRSVTLDGRRLWGLGLEVGADHVVGVALDLAGRTVFDRRLPVDRLTSDGETVIKRLAQLIDIATEAAAARGARLVEARVAVPGLVDAEHGVVVLAPNLGWQDLAIADRVGSRLAAPLPVLVASHADLSATAEHAYGAAAGTPDLIVLSGELGLGAGIIAGGRLLSGAAGFAGDVGHAQIDPAGRECVCGRRGCWETTVGLRAVLQAALLGDDPVPHPTVEVRLAELTRRAAAGDRRTLDALHTVGVNLGRGAAWLVSLFNPGALVLGGFLAPLSPYLAAAMRAEMGGRILAPDLGGCRLVRSSLGFTAAALGGAHLALSSVLTNPMIDGLRG